jgi:hypothetical protein
MTAGTYTTQLQAGLGMIAETQTLLDLWEPSMSASTLNHVALNSGRFPNMSARRLRNFVSECFAPRYLVQDKRPAQLLKYLKASLNQKELVQLFFIYTCRAQLILQDFVRDVFWSAYEAGRNLLTRDQAQRFVIQAKQNGKTTTPWSDSTVRRVSAYLLGCCVDYGLLDGTSRGSYKILPYRIEPSVAVILAHELHFAGLGDAGVILSPDWALFGMDRTDVLNELKRQALAGWMIVQSASDVTQISWRSSSMEDVIDGIAGR